MWGRKGSKRGQESEAAGQEKGSKTNGEVSGRLFWLSTTCMATWLSLEVGFWLGAYCRQAWGKGVIRLTKVEEDRVTMIAML